jgi:molybdopterin-containing oxidoreductase family iron-sulfur binding subunit
MPAGDGGYWKSNPAFGPGESPPGEFPPGADVLGALDRRRFMEMLGATLALAGTAGCKVAQPPERIVPYGGPEYLVPGEERFFATAFEVGGYGTGILGESNEGRPTKIEGNPGHPASLGATDARAQASVLSLYDPDRSRVVRHLDDIVTWGEFLTSLSVELESVRENRGRGLRLLTGAITSPTLIFEIRQLLAGLPEAGWQHWEPFGRHRMKAATIRAYGRYLEPLYHFEAADVVFSLGADFMGNLPGSLRYARHFVNRRRLHAVPDPSSVEREEDLMNRLWVAETFPTTTGSMADERIVVRPSDMVWVARSLASRLGVGPAPGQSPRLAPLEERIALAAEELASHRRSCLVLAGEEQPPEVHAAAFGINQVLENLARTVTFVPGVEPEGNDHLASLDTLRQEMENGDVDTLLVYGTNPAFTAPADFEFAAAMESVRLRIHHGLYDDETGALCHWHIPDRHYLETWGDTRGYDGTVSIIQPLIQPLYSGRSIFETLGAIGGSPLRDPREAVRSYWRRTRPSGGDAGFDRLWERSLSDGVVEDSQSAPIVPRLLPPAPEEDIAPAPAAEGAIEVVFLPDPAIFDGQFANNGWLQELPRPITKLVWTNAVFVSPSTAGEQDLVDGDIVEMTLGSRTLEGPVCIQPGQADGTVVLHAGNGRRRSGRIGNGVGFDAYRLRTSGGLYHATGLGLRKTDRREPLLTTQRHHSMEGRNFIPTATLDEFRENPDFAHESPEPEISMHPEFPENGAQWGMSIDLNACTGCSACVVACQAENNIPIVGPEQVAVGREMHWLRVDTYYRGTPEAPEIVHQPVACMHCEKAPCETVCPVGATVHSSDGLNEMVYNRCVGTRYCSNNCPYKVRRFNFLEYNDDFDEHPALRLLPNPDVTIRSKGVMEKCTYCVQRISRARIDAKTEDRLLSDGDIVTACQAVCPTQAIVFGNIADPRSRVSALKASSLSYSLLGELNIRPRTTYLGRVRNPPTG